MQESLSNPFRSSGYKFIKDTVGEGNGNPLQCSCLENPGTAKPGGLPSMGSHRVEHDWSDLAAAADTVWFCSWGDHQSLAVVKTIWEENHGMLPG